MTSFKEYLERTHTKSTTKSIIEKVEAIRRRLGDNATIEQVKEAYSNYRQKSVYVWAWKKWREWNEHNRRIR